jgi:hypothetical protein
LRTGVAAGDREVSLMSEVARGRYSHLTDEEIEAIYQYLKRLGAGQWGSLQPSGGPGKRLGAETSGLPVACTKSVGGHGGLTKARQFRCLHGRQEPVTGAAALYRERHIPISEGAFLAITPRCALVSLRHSSSSPASGQSSC